MMSSFDQPAEKMPTPSVRPADPWTYENKWPLTAAVQELLAAQQRFAEGANDKVTLLDIEGNTEVIGIVRDKYPDAYQRVTLNNGSDLYVGGIVSDKQPSPAFMIMTQGGVLRFDLTGEVSGNLEELEDLLTDPDIVESLISSASKQIGPKQFMAYTAVEGWQLKATPVLLGEDTFRMGLFMPYNIAAQELGERKNRYLGAKQVREFAHEL